MKRTICLLVLLVGAFCAGCDRAAVDPDARHEIFAAMDTVLREGDLVFRRGGGLTSRAVLAADAGGIYSHTGIVVRDDRGGSPGCGEWRVVHVVPGEPDENREQDRIKTEGLELFFATDRALSGAVARVATDEVGDGSAGIARRAAIRAAELVTTGLAFDHEYDLEDTTRMYCTELIHNVYMHVGLDLTGGKRSHINLPGFKGDYILPSDVWQSEYVTIIYQF